MSDWGTTQAKPIPTSEPDHLVKQQPWPARWRGLPIPSWTNFSTTSAYSETDDICILRDSGSVSETLRIDDLPPLYRTRYNALFAQKFLTVTVDLGTSFVAGFGSPTCVAQEIALRLVLDGVDEDSLFEDLGQHPVRQWHIATRILHRPELRRRRLVR